MNLLICFCSSMACIYLMQGKSICNCSFYYYYYFFIIIIIFYITEFGMLCLLLQNFYQCFEGKLSACRPYSRLSFF